MQFVEWMLFFFLLTVVIWVLSLLTMHGLSERTHACWVHRWWHRGMCSLHTIAYQVSPIFFSFTIVSDDGFRYVEYAYGWTTPAPFPHSEFSTIGKLCEVPHGWYCAKSEMVARWAHRAECSPWKLTSKRAKGQTCRPEFVHQVSCLDGKNHNY